MSEPTDAQALAERMLELFQQESSAGLDLIDATLEGSRADPAGVDTVFRAFHTLRGSAAMNGLDQLVDLARAFEDLFEPMRHGRQALGADTVALTAEAVCLLRRLLAAQGSADAELSEAIAALLERLSWVARAESPEAARPPDRREAESAQQLFHLIFEPGEQLMRRGVDVLALLDELAGLGELVLVPGLDRLPALDAMQPDSVYLGWRMLLRTQAGAEAVRDVFMFVAVDSQVVLQALSLAGPLDDDWALRARALLLRRPWLSPERLAQELCLPAKGPAFADGSEAPGSLPGDQSAVAVVIPVPVERLNRQIDLVGELVIAQSTLIQLAARLQQPQLSSAVEQVMRLTTDMRDNAMRLRMVPVGTLFADLAQAVADCAERLGRPLAFAARGADTELDLSVLQALRAPVLALLRGCAQQGLEPVEERARLGKPAAGQLSLSVEKAGAEVLLTVSDDGAGVPAAELETVRAAVEALRGTCEARPLPGQGSRHLLRLPLAQGIIDSLLVAVCGSTFVLPLAQVEEVVNLRTARGGEGHDQDILNLRGQLLPFVRLSRLFELDDGSAAPDGQVIVVSGGERRAGLLVDRVIGQQQTVIKGVPSLYAEDAALSGATILGDGTVALILDPAALLRQAEIELRVHPDGH
ncbi:chemotaxis protein CheW [Malikia sp.]|uniref:chemotaxis protein CheA n=1 Tax=Malikia sp. TaxID=2070706 RepID=UPI00261E44CE|nr:chemotaxis protein CheW [Malikia sp.]MDD2728712.1 chemotaxis protein CheW [Malikia sp.]